MTKKGIFLIIFLYIFSCISPVKATSELQLSVSYDVTCGEPTTFTLNASGGSGNYMYYLGNVTRDGEDGRYFVVDPSRLPGYQQSPIFQFTFLASGTYQLHFYVMDKGIQPIETKRTIVNVTINDPAYPSIEAIADQVASQCRSVCQTDYDRALWLHDWLVDHCSYDYSYLYCGAEGALVRGKGTCESYHRAYMMLLNRLGIRNGRMEGNGHVWTAVCMDGKWSQVDVTWDDNGYSYRTYENYIYFGLTDELMKVAHSQHHAHAGFESTSLQNNALLRSGRIHQWSDPIESIVQQNLSSGNKQFSIPINSTLPPSYQSIIYHLVAYQLSTQTWTTKDYQVKLQASYANQQLDFLATFTPITASKPEVTPPEDAKPVKPDQSETHKPTVNPPQNNVSSKPTVPDTEISQPSVGNNQIETVISRLENIIVTEPSDSVENETVLNLSYKPNIIYDHIGSMDSNPSQPAVLYILVLGITFIMIKYLIKYRSQKKKS